MEFVDGGQNLKYCHDHHCLTGVCMILLTSTYLFCSIVIVYLNILSYINSHYFFNFFNINHFLNITSKQ